MELKLTSNNENEHINYDNNASVVMYVFEGNSIKLSIRVHNWGV